MRLSEAIMLGSTTVKMKAGDWNSCAFGAACNALGIRQDGELEHTELTTSYLNHYADVTWDKIKLFRRQEAIEKLWPWLCRPTSFRMSHPSTILEPCIDGYAIVESYCWLGAITQAFDYLVVPGHWTLEALVDWVRSIEPAEQQEVELEAAPESDLVLAAL